MQTTATATPLTMVPPNQPQVRSLRGMIWRQFTRHQLAVVGMVVLLILLLGSLSVSWVSPYDPEKSSLREKSEPPSWTHPMGTDTLGRDMLTRLLYGGRISLTIGLLATVVGILIGTGVGALSGYFGGALDNILMRI